MIPFNTSQFIARKAADRYEEAERRLWARVPWYVRLIPGRFTAIDAHISVAAERIALLRAEKLGRKYGVLK